jgi:hypothetical protein
MGKLLLEFLWGELMRSLVFKNLYLAAAVSLALGFTGCSDKDDKKDPKKISENLDLMGLRASKSVLTVTDLDGVIIPGAKVLIGEAVSQSGSNFLTAGANGKFTAPTSWTKPTVVTISAPGYVRASYFAQLPKGQSFPLRKIAISGSFELKGLGTGFQIIDKDDKLDFAIMMPALNRDALFTFDLAALVSTQMDEFSVLGQKVSVPSNVVIPTQKESYGIFSPKFSKPTYRIYFPDLGDKKILTIAGQFPFKETVKEMQKQTPFAELVNLFTLKGGSIKSVTLDNSSKSIDLPVNEMVFNQSQELVAPAIPADDFLMAMPVSSYQGTLFPTDIKNLSSGQKVNLTIAAGALPEILLAQKKTAEQNTLGGGSLSAALMLFAPGITPELLPMIESPTVISDSEIKIKLPANNGKIEEVGTYSVLSLVLGTPAAPEEIRKWEVFAPTWISGFRLPQWPGDAPLVGKKRWTVSLRGTVTNKVIDLNPRLLKNVTHATFGSTDY